MAFWLAPHETSLLLSTSSNQMVHCSVSNSTVQSICCSSPRMLMPPAPPSLLRSPSPNVASPFWVVPVALLLSVKRSFSAGCQKLRVPLGFCRTWTTPKWRLLSLGLVLHFLRWYFPSEPALSITSTMLWRNLTTPFESRWKPSWLEQFPLGLV